MAFDEYTSQSTVKAEQIEETRSVITPQGAVTGLPMQWEVRYSDGNVRVLDDEAFKAEWSGGVEEPEASLMDAEPEKEPETTERGSKRLKEPPV